MAPSTCASLITEASSAHGEDLAARCTKLKHAYVKHVTVFWYFKLHMLTHLGPDAVVACDRCGRRPER